MKEPENSVPNKGNGDYIYDTEDFEEQVYEIVKKHVKI